MKHKDEYWKNLYPNYNDVANILSKAVIYAKDNKSQDGFVAELIEFSKKIKPTIPESEVRAFAQEAFVAAKKYSKSAATSDKDLLFFKTSIVRSLNEKLELHEDIPIIRHYINLCEAYVKHLEASLPRDFDGELMLDNEEKDDIVHLTLHKRVIIHQAIYLLSQTYQSVMNGLKDQDTIIKEFKSYLIKNEKTLSIRRDKCYVEFAKQLFTLGFVNLYRALNKGSITQGDLLLNKIGRADHKKAIKETHQEEQEASPPPRIG